MYVLYFPCSLSVSVYMEMRHLFVHYELIFTQKMPARPCCVCVWTATKWRPQNKWRRWWVLTVVLDRVVCVCVCGKGSVGKTVTEITQTVRAAVFHYFLSNMRQCIRLSSSSSSSWEGSGEGRRGGEGAAQSLLLLLLLLLLLSCNRPHLTYSCCIYFRATISTAQQGT